MASFDSFGTGVKRDFFGLFLGEEIGRGMSREVYAHALDPDLVLKIENEAGQFQNVFEWETWLRVRDTEHAKWFVPCEEISPSGCILIQRRTHPIRLDELPEKVPAFMTDLKPSNWGLLDGQPVCHDYGRHLLMEFGMGKRMVKARWRAGE